MAGVQIRYLNQLNSFFFSKICLGILLSGKNFYHIFLVTTSTTFVDLVRGPLQNSEFSASVAQQKFQLSPFPSFFSLFFFCI